VLSPDARAASRNRVAAFLCLMAAAAPAGAADDVARRGEYLFRAAGCAVCHTDTEHKGAPLAGGRALKTPFGTFYTPNITPDRETGIGGWSEAEFDRALRQGIDDEGEYLYPAFPYPSYTRLTDADVHAIRTYLFSRKPVHQENKEHELKWYVRYRPLIGFWRMLYFKPGRFQPRPDKPAAWNRGAYLVTAVGHCGECHTPRNFLGGLEESKRFSGNPDGVDGADVPNITPDRKTGIGAWSAGDIVTYLDSGMTPDGDFAGDIMADVIDDGTSHLTPDDRGAIAAYLMSVPPIETVRHEHKHHKKRNRKEDYE
jgi:mono/diheme cytochrome c family protein